MAAKTFSVVRDFASDGGLRGAVVAIGNFDGVHRGHKAVIAAAAKRAATLGCPAAALTFEPHPRSFFNPGEPLFRLTDEAAKLRLLAAAGLDGAIVLTFDEALAQLTAEEFVDRILVERFAVSGAAIGFNFHFGANRAGSPEFLASEGASGGFTVDVVPPLQDRGRPVSSRPIREALAAGRLDEAAELLGYPWFVSGPVIHGDKRGRELGFPTANLRARSGLRPAPRHLCGARRLARPPLRRRRELRPAADVRHRHRASRNVLVRFFRRSLRRHHRRRFHRFYSRRGDVRLGGELVRQMQDDSRRAREALARAGDAFPPI